MSDEREHDPLPHTATANGSAVERVSDVHALPPSEAPAAGSLMQAALDLVEVAGVRVHPMHPVLADGRCACQLTATKTCKSAGKHPRVVAWQREASADPGRVRLWWRQTPTANIGIAPGGESGIVVLDIDGPLGEASLAALVREHGALPDTVEARSGRPDGGRHLYFAAPAYRVSKSTGTLSAGLDLIGEGGNIIAPPSMHASGAPYRWVAGRELGAYGLAPFPQWLAPPQRQRVTPEPLRLAGEPVRSAAQMSSYLRTAIERESAEVLRAPVGQRNVVFNRAVFNLATLQRQGLPMDVVAAHMTRLGLQIGLGELETARTLSSALRGGTAAAPRVLAAPPQAGNHSGTTAGNHSGTTAGDQSAPASTPPAQATAPTTPAITWVGPDRIFAPLPPMTWVSPDLMIGPGRPTELIAYGGTGKSLAMQALGLASAAGAPIWSRFGVPQAMRVCHLDYEQGARDTFFRYQRLAIGHGVDLRALSDRLRVAAMPSVYLTDEAAYEAYARIADQHDLVMIDSLRASTPGVDENDSSVRSYIDVLTRVSEATGAAFLFIHHTGKSGGGYGSAGRDKRELGRGSSAIFDGCGCVLSIELGSEPTAPRKVTMTKPPTSSEGAVIAPFGLVISDVARDGNPRAGVAVTWVELAAPDDQVEANAAYDRDVERLLGAIAAQPGASTRTIRTRVGMKHARCADVLAGMVADGLVTLVTAARRANTYWPVQSK